MISRHFANSPNPRTTRGFTLIELMVVVAIVAILAAVAIPSYADYVQRSRIISATSALSDVRVKMEQYYLDNRTYLAGGGACGIDATKSSSTSFAITCAAAANTYTVTATGQAAGNMQNFTYTIDQSGVKTTVSAPAGWVKTAGCWAVRKDGTCV